MYFSSRRRIDIVALLIMLGMISSVTLSGNQAVMAQSESPVISQVRELENDETGVANPTGLAFSPGAGVFHVVAGVGGEISGSTSTEIVRLTSFGDYDSSVRVHIAIDDAINMAFDSRFSRLLILQSASSELVAIGETAGGNLDPATLTRHPSGHFGVENPQGIAVDPSSGHLFILDGATNRMIRVEPAADGTFDSAVVSDVTLAADDLDGPRGLALDPTNGHLYLVSTGGEELYEFTQSGEVVAKHELSQFDVGSPRGMVFAPSRDQTDDPAEMSLYMTDSRADVQQVQTVRPTDSELPSVQPAGQSREQAGAPLVVDEPLGMDGMVTPDGGGEVSEDVDDSTFENRFFLPLIRGGSASAGSIARVGGATAARDLGSTDSSGNHLYLPQVAGGLGDAGDVPQPAIGRMMEFSFVEPAVASAAALNYTSALVRTTDTSQLSPPSPDSAGITYLSTTERLLMSDSEVNEMPIYAGANLFEMSLGGSLLDTSTTLSLRPFRGHANEPTGTAFRPGSDPAVFVSDDNKKEIFVVDQGPTGSSGQQTTLSHILTRLRSAAGIQRESPTTPGKTSCSSPMGSIGKCIVLRPDPNGVFDGVAPVGDDQVTSFDTLGLGVEDPEGIAYNVDTGNLYIVGKPENMVLEVTIDGTDVQAIDISTANPDKPAGSSLRPRQPRSCCWAPLHCCPRCG